MNRFDNDNDNDNDNDIFDETGRQAQRKQTLKTFGLIMANVGITLLGCVLVYKAGYRNGRHAGKVESIPDTTEAFNQARAEGLEQGLKDAHVVDWNAGYLAGSGIFPMQGGHLGGSRDAAMRVQREMGLQMGSDFYDKKVDLRMTMCD